jgi:hypothetical protein
LIEVHAKKNCSICYGRGKALKITNTPPPQFKNVKMQGKAKFRINEICICAQRRAWKITDGKMKLPEGTPFEIKLLEPPT